MWHQMASELTGACTWATGTSNVHTTRAFSPSQTGLGTRWQDQAHMSEKLHHRDMMEMRWRLRRRCCDAATNGALDSRIRTSGHISCGNKIFSSGNVTSRSSRQWLGEVLKRRCCQVRSRGDTDEVGPQQPGYIPNWATLPPPAGAVSGWVMTP